MNRLDPSKTAIAISIPSRSPPFDADKEAKTSGAPPPKASSVTPARDSESLNVFDICCSDGDKNSSAVKLSRKNAMARDRTYRNKTCAKLGSNRLPLAETYPNRIEEYIVAIKVAKVEVLEVYKRGCLAVLCD